MDGRFPLTESPVQRWRELGERIGAELLVKRDDLLPFPLAGNKYRKLAAEYRAQGWTPGDALISNGGIDSNHCRTLALLGAQLGCKVHLVLHGDPRSTEQSVGSLRMLADLGATYEIVRSTEIAAQVADAERRARATSSSRVWVIPGGAHTPAAVSAFRRSARTTLREWQVDHVVVASGTGATQAGIILGAHEAGDIPVTGVSVARGVDRGAQAVRECLSWFDADDLLVRFDDRFIDGGYAKWSDPTSESVALGWRYGLPLDPTYTGKAFRGLVRMVATGEISSGSSVLFWHTGGLHNYLAARHREGVEDVRR